MTYSFVFPGQGSQAVGMGAELAQNFTPARAVFEEVNDALGFKLDALMFEGPLDELTLTQNAQPALMAVSMAVVKVIEAETGRSLADIAQAVAGHSLGEYSALCAVGVLSLSDTARLLRLRGQAMQSAVPVGQGAMAAIIGPSFDDITEIAQAAAEGQVCDVANDNAPGQVVISGDKAAVERAIELAKDKGAKRSVLLPVSAPFHCALMQPAADAMAEAFEGVSFTSASVPIVCNVTAQPEQDPEALKQNLVTQVCNMVRWREGVLTLASMGITETIEAGSGKVLTGLSKRIDRSLKGQAVGDVAAIQSFLNALNEGA